MMGGTSLFGPSTILERTYSSLPAHSYISFMLRGINANLWTVPTDSISIYLDGGLFRTQYPSSDILGSTQSYCGNINKDYIWYDTEAVMAHSSSTLTLKYVISNSDYATASYGLYKLAILFRTAIPYRTSQSCIVAPNPPVDTCLGAISIQYIINGGGFGPCHSSCDNSCFGPGSAGCYACGLGYFFDGINCLPCDTTCLVCSGAANNQCVLCKGTDILQNDNTCSSAACVGPNVLDMNGGDIKKCIYNPCSTGQFIFYNLDGTITCMPTCVSPYTVYNTNFCQLCTIGQYRTYDSTGTLYCAPSCAAPYQPMQNNQYCLLCDLGTYIWYSSQGQLVCLPNCPQPYQIFNSIYCVLCPTDEFVYYAASDRVVCMKVCTFPYVMFSSHTVHPSYRQYHKWHSDIQNDQCRAIKSSAAHRFWCLWTPLLELSGGYAQIH